MGALRFALHAARRHWAVALSIALGTFALAWASVKALPKTWHAEAVLSVDPGLVLTDPSRQRQGDAAGIAMREALMARPHLAEVARRTDLLKRWDETRAPLGRLVDRLRRRPPDDERFEALLDVLEARMYVVTSDGTLRIGVLWPDGQSAYAIVQAAQEVFLANRQARNEAMIRDSITVLDKHAADAGREVDTALSALITETARSPRPLLAGVRDPETQRIALMLAARRRAIEHIEEQRRVRVGELQKKLAERRATAPETDPEVAAMTEAITSLLGDSPELLVLRTEEAKLSRAYQAREGHAPPALQPTPGETRLTDDPTTDYARARLRTALERHETLVTRIDAARLELEVAKTAFKYRYAVLKPAQVPRRPGRPDSLAVMAGGVLVGLVFGLLAAAIAEKRQVEATKLAAAGTVMGAASVAILFSSGNVLAAFAPAGVVGVGWASARAPLRYTLATLMFLVMALLGPGDASGLYLPPWAPIGRLLQANLNKTVPVDALRFTGVDVVVVAMIAIGLARYLTRSRVDGETVKLPRGLKLAALGSLCAVLFTTAWGVVQGGADANQILWQVHQIALVPVVALVAAMALRGPRDFALLGKVVLAAAMAKALQAIWVRYGMGLNTEICPTATTHADSILFATAFGMVLAWLFEAHSRRAVRWALLCLPILALAMHANYRRLVWVEVAAVIVAIFALAPRTRFKLAVTRALLALAPVLLLYVAAGWRQDYRGGGSAIFAPVAQLRSVIDSSASRSTQERDIENFNLVSNAVHHPVLGLGFGHEYTSFTYSDDISRIFPQWKYIPHNSVLGLLAFGGVVGFFGFWAVLIAAVYCAARGYRFAQAPLERAAALSAIGAVLVYLLQCYGDMGFVSWNSVFLLGPAAAVAGQLATSSGAWS